MEFVVRFYETTAGDKPMDVFLRSLEAKQPILHDLIVTRITQLEQRRHHRPPRTERVAGTEGLFELRAGSADIVRVFFFFRPGREIICTHGYVKKSRKLDPREVERARRYQADWEARNP